MIIQLTLGLILALVPIAAFTDDDEGFEQMITETQLGPKQCISQNFQDCLQSVCTYQDDQTCRDQCQSDAVAKCSQLDEQE